MRLSATCLDCGFENPRTWVSCARCGGLLGPRLRLSSDSGSGSQSGTGTTRRVPPPEPPPPLAETDPDADAPTGLYAQLGTLRPPSSRAPEPREPRAPFGQQATAQAVQTALVQ